MSEQKSRQATDWQALMVWVPGFLVAIGAGAATAHGLFTVATATGVPGYIAWVYPLITDGLALVAYAAATRLGGRSRGYAWFVVVLAAGLSGLAQASYLANGSDLTAPPHSATATVAGGSSAAVLTALRIGVGAWPAIAAAIVAHLLFMLAAEHRPASSTTPSADRPDERDPSTAPAVQPAPRVQPVQPRQAVQARPVEQPAVQEPAREVSAQRSIRREVVRRMESPELESGEPDVVAGSFSMAGGPRDVARAAARSYFAETGEWPTVSVLVAIAQVARGTAGTALKELRDQPAPLRIVHTSNDRSANQ